MYYPSRANYNNCTAMFPASKFQSLQVTVATLNHKTGVRPDRVQQHAVRFCTISTLHSTQHTGCRLRRPYTTSRPQFTQSNKGNNPQRGPVHESTFSTRRTRHNQCSSSCSNCVTQFRVDCCDRRNPTILYVVLLYIMSVLALYLVVTVAP